MALIQRGVPKAPLATLEVGRREFDGECANLFFGIVDRRYEKEGPGTLILASNTPTIQRGDSFTGDDALPWDLDGVFDRASVFMMI